jgi:hypothetical protein
MLIQLNSHKKHPIKRVLHPQKSDAATKEGATTTEKGKKHRRKPYDEEAVRVDEEGMYSDTNSIAVLSDSSYDTDLPAPSDSDINSSDPEYDPDDEILDEEEEEIHPVSYDIDDSCIDVGRVFTNVK